MTGGLLSKGANISTVVSMVSQCTNKINSQSNEITNTPLTASRCKFYQLSHFPMYTSATPPPGITILCMTQLGYLQSKFLSVMYSKARRDLCEIELIWRSILVYLPLRLGPWHFGKWYTAICPSWFRLQTFFLKYAIPTLVCLGRVSLSSISMSCACIILFADTWSNDKKINTKSELIPLCKLFSKFDLYVSADQITMTLEQRFHVKVRSNIMRYGMKPNKISNFSWLVFCRIIHRWPADFFHKGSVIELPSNL